MAARALELTPSVTPLAAGGLVSVTTLKRTVSLAGVSSRGEHLRQIGFFSSRANGRRVRVFCTCERGSEEASIFPGALESSRPL